MDDDNKKKTNYSKPIKIRQRLQIKIIENCTRLVKSRNSAF